MEASAKAKAQMKRIRQQLENLITGDQEFKEQEKKVVDMVR